MRGSSIVASSLKRTAVHVPPLSLGPKKEGCIRFERLVLRLGVCHRGTVCVACVGAGCGRSVQLAPFRQPSQGMDSIAFLGGWARRPRMIDYVVRSGGNQACFHSPEGATRMIVRPPFEHEMNTLSLVLFCHVVQPQSRQHPRSFAACGCAEGAALESSRWGGAGAGQMTLDGGGVRAPTLSAPPGVGPLLLACREGRQDDWWIRKGLGSAEAPKTSVSWALPGGAGGGSWQLKAVYLPGAIRSSQRGSQGVSHRSGRHRLAGRRLPPAAPG